jgi:hypothetical protein
MIAEWIKNISGWEEEYIQMRECDPGPFLTDTELEILQKDGLAANEGMIYGRMYADWKKRKDYNVEENIKLVNSSKNT